MEPSFDPDGEDQSSSPNKPDDGFLIDDAAFDRQLRDAMAGGMAGGSSTLGPLSKERIEDALRAENWTFNVDSDGDIGGLWDSNVFYFFTYGDQQEILQVRGRWHQDLPIGLRSQVREALDEWHFTKIWPKGYTTVDDSGRVWVLAEHSVDWEHGVTDDQLRLTLRCAITTSLSLFKKLHERFVTLAPKE